MDEMASDALIAHCNRIGIRSSRRGEIVTHANFRKLVISVHCIAGSKISTMTIAETWYSQFIDQD